MKANYYSLEAENAILGAILINNDIYDEISDLLQEKFFYFHESQKVFNLITTLILQGKKADVLTVSRLASFQDDLIKDTVTIQYLTDLITATPNFDSVKDYAAIIKDFYVRRELVEFFTRHNHNITNAEDVFDVLNALEVDLFQLAENFFVGDDIKSFATSLETALKIATDAKKSNGISGIPTHFSDIDKHLGGLQKSDLIIIAGRPAMGKTALATNIAYNIASLESDAPVLVFSLEMSAEQLASRILAQETNIESETLRKGYFTDNQLQHLVVAVSALKNKPFFIDDSSMLTVSELRTKARRFKRRHNLALIVVDYLQLMSSNRKSDNRIIEISEITRGLKAVAKELDVPIIALSQLSRAVESREDKKPVLSDLRESGAIEQDADLVAFIYREEYYLQRGEPIVASESDKTQSEEWQKWYKKLEKVRNLATLLIAKNRHGSTKNINLRFNSKFTKFENLDTTHQP